MSNSSAYIQLNQDNYRSLVDDLVHETEQYNPNRDPTLTEARRTYFTTAIAKGSVLSELFLERVASFSADDLIMDAESLRDKQSSGWRGITSLAEADRKNFAEAGNKRLPEMKWDNLFPAEIDDFVLPFSENAQSFDDKIQNFISAYNDRSKNNFLQAQERDATTLQSDPAARATAGRSIDQQLIRRNPDDPSKLQTYKPDNESWQTPDWTPKEENWKQGPKFGKFLQDQYEWSLFDVVQRETESKNKRRGHTDQAEGQEIALKDLANRATQNADHLYDKGSLSVVISRDPQKIGEMSHSTGLIF